MYAQPVETSRVSKAAKRQAAEERRGMFIWLPIVLAVNVTYAYFGVAFRLAEVSFVEWTLIALSLAAHYWAYTGIITWWAAPKLSSSKAGAKDRESGGQDGVDILAIVSMSQLGSLFTSWAWLGLLVVAGMLAYKAYTLFASAKGALTGMMGGAAAAAGEGDGEAEAAGPRKTRAEVKAEEEEKQRKREMKKARKMAKHGRR